MKQERNKDTTAVKTERKWRKNTGKKRKTKAVNRKERKKERKKESK